MFGAQRGERDGPGIGIDTLVAVDLGEPHVENLDRAVIRKHDVFRLDVPMDNPVIFRCHESEADIMRNPGGAMLFQRSLPLEQILGAAAADVFHDEIHVVLVVSAVINSDDIRMVQFRADFCGFDETVAGRRIRDVFHAQGFERYRNSQIRMDSLVELSHAAVPDEFRDLILPDLFRDDAVDFGIFFENGGVIDFEFAGTDTFHIATM